MSDWLARNQLWNSSKHQTMNLGHNHLRCDPP
jgi:hypothetical protein